MRVQLRWSSNIRVFLFLCSYQYPIAWLRLGSLTLEWHFGNWLCCLIWYQPFQTSYGCHFYFRSWRLWSCQRTWPGTRTSWRGSSPGFGRSTLRARRTCSCWRWSSSRLVTSPTRSGKSWWQSFVKALLKGSPLPGWCRLVGELETGKSIQMVTHVPIMELLL